MPLSASSVRPTESSASARLKSMSAEGAEWSPWESAFS